MSRKRSHHAAGGNHASMEPDGVRGSNDDEAKEDEVDEHGQEDFEEAQEPEGDEPKDALPRTSSRLKNPATTAKRREIDRRRGARGRDASAGGLRGAAHGLAVGSPAVGLAGDAQARSKQLEMQVGGHVLPYP